MKTIKLFLIIGCIIASVIASPANYNIQGVFNSGSTGSASSTGSTSSAGSTSIVSRHGDNYNVQGVFNTGSTRTKGPGKHNFQGVVNTGVFKQVD